MTTTTKNADGRTLTFAEWMAGHIKTYSADRDGDYIVLVEGMLKEKSFQRIRSKTGFCHAMCVTRQRDYHRHIEQLWCDYVYYVCNLPASEVHPRDAYIVAEDNDEAFKYGGKDGFPRQIPRTRQPKTYDQAAEEKAKRERQQVDRQRKEAKSAKLAKQMKALQANLAA